MGKKKIGIILGAIAVAAAAAIGIWYFLGNNGKDSKDRVYVEKVSSIMGKLMGAQNRYSGIVQPQETVEVNADPDRTVSEVYVEVGDTVEVGTPLFTYDTEDLTLELEQAKLELDNQDIEISNFRKQIQELEKERSAAAEANKFEYTTQIQTIETQIKQAEFTKSSKQLEINKLQKRVDNSQVNSTASGIIRTIDDGESQMNEDTSAFITILSTGEYRVKGTVNEQNIGMIYDGQAVIIRSRVDEDLTWTGTIESLDTESASDSSQDDMMYEGDSGNTSSSYSFYVTLDDAEDLILGQHVLIEMDEGQTEEREGIWLQSGYVVFEGAEGAAGAQGMDYDMDYLDGMDTEMLYDYLDGMDTEMLMDYDDGMDMDMLMDYDDGMDTEYMYDYEDDSEAFTDSEGPAYVWADNGSGRLEKREVVLGEYDDSLDQYEILSGLSEDDLIAWPMAGLYEGVRTVTDMEEVDYTSDLYNQEMDTEYTDGMDGMDDWYEDEEMYNPDGMYEDGEIYDDGTTDGEDYNGEAGDDGSEEKTDEKDSALTDQNGNKPLGIDDFMHLEGIR